MRPDRIGLFGGSAGGHLAASVGTMWDAAEGRTGAAIDSVSACPDFAMLIYPVVTMEEPFVYKGSRDALLGKTPAPDLVQLLSIEKHVRKDTPPMFLVATMADQSVPVENSLHLYKALRDAGVPAEMHVYTQGAHGSSRQRAARELCAVVDLCDCLLELLLSKVKCVGDQRIEVLVLGRRRDEREQRDQERTKSMFHGVIPS